MHKAAQHFRVTFVNRALQAVTVLKPATSKLYAFDIGFPDMGDPAV